MPKPAPGSGFLQVSHPKKRAVLIGYAESGHVGNACANATITPRMHQYWLKDDPVYAAAFEEARAMAAQALEDEARRRAVVCGSDLLLIFLLKGAMPDKYKDRHEFQHKGAIELLHKLQQLPSMTDDTLDDLLLEAERYARRD